MTIFSNQSVETSGSQGIAPSTENGACSGSDALPEQVPAGEHVEARRPWWIPWPLAILLAPLLWLMPKRMGTHFATVRWPGPLIAHVLCVIYVIAALFVLQEEDLLRLVREAIALQSSLVTENGLVIGNDWSDIIWTPIAVLALSSRDTAGGEILLPVGLAWLTGGLAFMVLALCQTTYACAGESRGALLRRCFKLSWWLSTALLLLLVVRVFGSSSGWPWGDPDLISLAIFLLILARIWVQSTARYPGPAEGADSESLPLRCEACGYRLAGLHPEQDCPECGQPVRDSLPENRQPVPALRWRRPWCTSKHFIRLLCRMLFTRAPMKRIAVHSGRADARRFALLCSGLGAALMPYTLALVTPIVAPESYQEWTARWGDYPEITFQFLVLIGTLTLWGNLLLITVVPTLSLPFTRNLLPRVKTALLHAAWLIPINLAIAVLLPVILELHLTGKVGEWYGASEYAVKTILVKIVLFGMMLLIVPVFALDRLIHSLKHVRYANA